MSIWRIGLIISISVLMQSCMCQNSDTLLKENDFVRFQYDLTNLDTVMEYKGPIDKGIIQNAAMIPEASGLSACQSNPKILWVHNDSGNANHLHAVGTGGENKGFFWIRGIGNRDWEDICVGPGPASGKAYVYIGDIGDNQAKYNEILIHRFMEPDMASKDSIAAEDIPAENVESFTFKYPEGPRDAETLMIDPWTKDLYIVTKREARSSLYVANFPYETGKTNWLKKVGEFPFNRALAGDISPDGTQIVIKTDRRLYFWQREKKESIIDALIKQPGLLPYFVEPQGESFGWSADGKSYYTLSEQSGDILPKLYQYTQME
jgi:hypothetical protein